MKLIDSFSFLPNLHQVTHENIFSKETDILHDTKQLKKRHFGLLAANLVAAVRGRANAKTLRSSPNPVHRYPPSTSRSLYTTPIEVPGFLSHTVKNSQTRAYPTPRTQQPSPLCSSYDSPSEGYFFTVMLSKMVTPHETHCLVTYRTVRFQQKSACFP